MIENCCIATRFPPESMREDNEKMASQDNPLESYKTSAKSLEEATQKVSHVITPGISTEEVQKKYSLWPANYEHVRILEVFRLNC